MPQGNVYRRRQIDIAKQRGEVFVKKAVLPLLTAQLKWLTRDLRKSNLRHRLKKNDGVLYKIGEYPDTWQGWADYFEDTLRTSTANGAGYLWTVEQQYFTSNGYNLLRVDIGDVINDYMLRGNTRIGNINTNTETAVNQTIADWFNTDAGLPELIQQLESWFSPQRAELIATTEMAYVASNISVRQMKEYGIAQWRWDAFNDGVTCDICLGLMAQSKQTPFTINDPMPPDPSHPRCRCGVFYIL